MDYLFRPTYPQKDHTLSWPNTIPSTPTDVSASGKFLSHARYSLVRVTLPLFFEKIYSFARFVRTLKRVSRRKANK